MAERKLMNGVEVMCIQDNQDLSIGDKGIITDVDFTTGKMLLVGSPTEYDMEFFRATGAEIVDLDPTKVNKQDVCHFIEDIMKSCMFNMSGGVVLVEAIINKCKYHMVVLGLKDQFFEPKNLPKG